MGAVALCRRSRSRHVRRVMCKNRLLAPHRVGRAEAKAKARSMNADDFRIGVFHGNEDIGAAFPDGDRLRHIRSPHFIDLVSDDRPIVRARRVVCWYGDFAACGLRAYR